MGDHALEHYDKIRARFEKFLDKKGYDPAVEVCPVDQGELLFVSGCALDFVDEFMNEMKGEYDRDDVDNVASDIGEISDMFRDGPEPGLDLEPYPEPEPDPEEEELSKLRARGTLAAAMLPLPLPPMAYPPPPMAYPPPPMAYPPLPMSAPPPPLAPASWGKRTPEPAHDQFSSRLVGITGKIKERQREIKREEPKVELSPDQEAALGLTRDEDGPFCLMGGAGTGKSFLVQQMVKRFHPYICASTGIAAQNVHGTTLHSFLGMRPRSEEPDYDRVEDRVSGHDMVIVDEISMVNAWLFDRLIKAMKISAAGVKLVLVGDFLQLPPVEGGFAFKSPEWEQVRPITLTTQHRQHDTEFVDALYDLRTGRQTDRLASLVRDHTAYYAPKDCTQLAPLRAMVGSVNNARLAELPGEEHRYTWTFLVKDKHFSESMAERRCRFSKLLRLKVGARVVMLTNSGAWNNGSTGEVVGFQNGMVIVELDRGHHEVVVARETEEVLGGDKQIQGTVTQYPMMLGFAMTIHKAQGMTMDRVAIDLTGHFAPGQTYVALSRCSSKEGLFLFGDYRYIPPDPDALRVCGEV